MKNEISAHGPGAESVSVQSRNTHSQKAMDSFNTLIEAQVPALRRYAVSLRGSIGDHDELVRDCLEQAVSEEKLFEADSDVRIWLLTILHKQLVTRYSHKQSSAGAIALDIDFNAPTAHNANQEENNIPDVEYALTLLPDDQKEVFLLVSLEQLTYKEVGEVLDLPMGPVMSRLTQARKLLKEILTMGNSL